MHEVDRYRDGPRSVQVLASWKQNPDGSFTDPVERANLSGGILGIWIGGKEGDALIIWVGDDMT